MPRSDRAIFILLYVSLMMPVALCAQKFHFQNYNVQQGLIQSQVNSITQDHFDNIWFCTLGGISRFDGKEFTNYSETDGLISNYTTSILAGRDSNVWIGTSYGLSKFNGKDFENIRFSGSADGNVVRYIKEDAQKRIWVLVGGKLFYINPENKAIQDSVSGAYEKVSAIQVNELGILYAVVLSRGIYRRENNKWQLLATFPENSGTSPYAFYQKMIFDRQIKDKMYLLSGDVFFSLLNGDLRQMIKPGSIGKISNIFIDKSNKLWVAGSMGVYQYADSGLMELNSKNGYDGNATSVIFQDREDNFWFGTNGTGAYRYSYQPFLIYDQFTSSKNTAVMPMLMHKGRLFIGTDGDGLFEYEEGNFKNLNLPVSDQGDGHINGIFPGRQDEIYVLTGKEQLYKYRAGNFSPVPLGDSKSCINDILPDDRKGFWIATCRGLTYLSAEGKSDQVFNLYSGKMIAVANDSVLLSTGDGLYVVGPDFQYRKMNDPLLNNARYMALAALGNYLLLATSNKGFILYNSKTGFRKQYTTKDGLNSDFIYSVISDNKNQIWLGTGRGINKLLLDTLNGLVKISNLSIPGDISSAECNQGAAVYDDKKNLWFGTVSGLFKFLPDSSRKQSYLPPVILQQVQVFSKNISSTRFTGLTNSWYNIPDKLTLPHNENHLTFSFGCPSYVNSESIQYQYQLEGMEKNYSALTSNHFVVYPALPPGHYTFRARAYLEGLGYSKENIAFAFDIKAAFYQTLYFKFLLLVGIMALIWWIQWMRMRMRVNQLNEIEEVKREENIKVRQTASEDFHDEVGNSLTRIQVLTDVLQTKLGKGHDEEKRIIIQIKENVSGLYQGTRDILWALNPESDMMKEIGHRLESLGIDVFQDTGICFSYQNLIEEEDRIKLPGNYNRNIMMIFKEAMSNCLKHAQARHLKLRIMKSESKDITIELSDDGIGFNPLFIKKGHGFQNMQKRAGRIKSTFEVFSAPGQGCRYVLNIPFSA